MRRLLLAIGMLLAGGLLVWQLGRGVQLPLFDFAEYWAAGHLNVHNQNPYDPELVAQLERDAGRGEKAVLMWNPPWTLPFVMPFGLLEVHTAQLLWLLVQFAVLAFCVDRLWLMNGGNPQRRWIAWLLAFTFAPCYFALIAGQISPLLLLGAVLFLLAMRANRFFLAGISTLLLAIKPHLALLFWAALLLEIVRRRNWSLLAGGVVAGIIATLIAVAFHPTVLADYWHTLSTKPPEEYDSPTLGMLLRRWLGRERFALQFVPPLLGLLWLAVHWVRNRHKWNWDREMPLLILASILTAAYGAWPFDLVLVLPPVMQVAARPRRPRLALALHVAINALALVLLLCRAEFFAFLWMPPALLLGYLFTRSEPLTEERVSP